MGRGGPFPGFTTRAVPLPLPRRGSSSTAAAAAAACCHPQSARVAHRVQAPGGLVSVGSGSSNTDTTSRRQLRMVNTGAANDAGGRVGPRGAVVRDIPLREIARPLAGTRTNDPAKVERLMESIREEGQKTPIDVFNVEGRYYGFNGCHRFEACQRLGHETIKCRVYKATREILRRQMM